METLKKDFAALIDAFLVTLLFAIILGFCRCTPFEGPDPCEASPGDMGCPCVKDEDCRRGANCIVGPCADPEYQMNNGAVCEDNVCVTNCATTEYACDTCYDGAHCTDENVADDACDCGCQVSFHEQDACEYIGP